MQGKPEAKTPQLGLFGFKFLLAFVGASIPAAIAAKVLYGAQLADVDWLHGSAESFLTLTNLFIVLGFRRAVANGDSSFKVVPERFQSCSSRSFQSFLVDRNEQQACHTLVTRSYSGRMIQSQSSFPRQLLLLRPWSWQAPFSQEVCRPPASRRNTR